MIHGVVLYRVVMLMLLVKGRQLSRLEYASNSARRQLVKSIDAQNLAVDKQGLQSLQIILNLVQSVPFRERNILLEYVVLCRKLDS